MKRVLDVCASTRKWWPLAWDAKHVAVDLDPKVRPDVVADFRRLPFPDDSFDEVWADPPHTIRPERPSGASRVRYGAFGRFRTQPEARDAMHALVGEALRVARMGGRVFIKATIGGDRRRTLELHDFPYGYAIVRRTKSAVTWSNCDVVLLSWTKRPMPLPLLAASKNTPPTSGDEP